MIKENMTRDSGEKLNEAVLLQKIARLERDLNSVQETMRLTRRHLKIAKEKLNRAYNLLDAFQCSTSWRITQPIRLLRDRLKFLEIPLKRVCRRGGSGKAQYHQWIALYDVLYVKQKNKIIDGVKKMDSLVLVSVVMHTYNTRPDFLREAIESVKRQLYPHWELCIADNASTEPHVRKILSGYAQSDARIKIYHRETMGSTSEAGSDALAIAAGKFVALLGHNDVLSENALYEVARAIQNNPSASLFYSDEDQLDADGTRYEPHFKPDWNPDLFLSQNYFSNLGVYKREIIEQAGGCQGYDLTLRCVEIAGYASIRHIPKMLYHRRNIIEETAAEARKQNYAAQTAAKAIGAYLARQHIGAEVTELEPNAGLYRVKYELPSPPPRVSIIIPTRDAVSILKKCLASIFEKTSYPNYEIILVDNGSEKKKSLSYFKELAQKSNIVVVRDDGPFNYSRLNNHAVELSNGEVLCLLNNDTVVITPDWLDEMVSHALRQGIGAVGARLWYPNGTLQHGGLILGIGGVACHVHSGLRSGGGGYMDRALVTQNISAVTAACLVIKKSIYRQVGGLNEKLPVTCNDVDFCLRVINAGYRNLWTPFAELYHREAATRGDDSLDCAKTKRARKEEDYMFDTYGDALKQDPAYNPNLSLELPFAMAFPPRIARQ